MILNFIVIIRNVIKLIIKYIFLNYKFLNKVFIKIVIFLFFGFNSSWEYFGE